MKYILLFVVGLLILVALGMVAQGAQPLIADFNTIRSTPLAESALLDTSAQAASANSCAKGGYILPTSPPGATKFAAWFVYGYSDAASVWAAQQTDPNILQIISDPAYNAAGVGTATPCGDLGILWTIELAHLSSVTPPTQPPGTPIPTPTTTIGATGSATASPFPRVTAACGVDPDSLTTPNDEPDNDDAGNFCTATPAATLIPPATATPVPVLHLFGDVDCDGVVTSRDAQAILKFVVDLPPLSQTQPCPAVGSPQ